MSLPFVISSTNHKSVILKFMHTDRTMSSRLTYGFLTGQLCFDLQAPQTLKDWKWIYISSKFILQYSTLQSCSHSATQARNTRLLCQPPPPTPGLITAPRKYSTGMSPPLCSFWCQRSGHPSGLDDVLTSGSALESSPYIVSRGIGSKCTADSSTLRNKTSPAFLFVLFSWNTSGTPRCGTSGVGIILQPPLPLPRTSEHVPSHTQPCDFPPPTMLCVDSLSLFAWLPLSRLFSPVSPSRPSPLTHCIWLNSFSPIKVQFRGHLLQVACWPLPRRARHTSPALRWHLVSTIALNLLHYYNYLHGFLSSARL